MPSVEGPAQIARVQPLRLLDWFARLANPGARGAAEDLRPDHGALLPYAERMWFSLTLEGGGFVAFDAPNTPFWSERMPAHLRETLLEFTARGYFTHIIQREYHHRCFRAWREVFETERLFREVSDEVRELHGILLMRKTERLQQLAEEQRRLMEAQARAEAEREKAEQARADRLGRWFGAVAFLLGFPSLVLAFLQVLQEKSPVIAGAGLGVSFLVGAIMMFGLHLWLRRREHASALEPDETSEDHQNL